MDGLREGREAASSSIVRTRGGALVIVHLDSTTYRFSWDNTINQPKDDCRLEINEEAFLTEAKKETETVRK